MALSKSLEAVLDKAKENDEYWMDSAKFDFAIAIETKRREMGINYKTLANNLGKTPAYISMVYGHIFPSSFCITIRKFTQYIET